uniref:Uncharacterized protein n=1 Tax=Daphnia magna TaxID=35525 RepID=A0A0N8CZW2_9CRUS
MKLYSIENLSLFLNFGKKAGFLFVFLFYGVVQLANRWRSLQTLCRASIFNNAFSGSGYGIICHRNCVRLSDFMCDKRGLAARSLAGLLLNVSAEYSWRLVIISEGGKPLQPSSYSDSSGIADG